jgi:hypothetical protein
MGGQQSSNNAARKKKKFDSGSSASGVSFSNGVSEPSAAELADYNRKILLARNRRQKRPKFEDWFVARLPQEEIIPCVCDGRYDGMEDVVSWIACDCCEAWFHGEWVSPSAVFVFVGWVSRC